MQWLADLEKDSRKNLLLIGCVLAFVTLAVYGNSFSGAFIFDDHSSIDSNPTIQHLWPFWGVLSAPAGTTAGGRPLVNLSLAINYAIGGVSVWGYHFFNLVIHILAGLTLLGVLHRTFARIKPNWPATGLSGLICLLWLLHPLQTESVTYVVQRAEAMVSLCYLLTIYCVIRAIDEPARRRWEVLAIVACFAGMLCKEVMISAPVMVLLYDRTYVTGSLKESLHKRPRLYIGLFSSILVMAFLVYSGGRGSSVGYNSYVTGWMYLLTQCRAIVIYLGLVLWPSRLIFDYGMLVDSSLAAVGWQAAVLLLLLAATCILMWWRPRIGFAGLLFFALLAPSSSIIPITSQTIAEHRMYLALAPMLALIVVGIYLLIGQHVAYLALAWAALLGWRTVERNADYQSELVLWQDTVAKWPQSKRAHHELAAALTRSGRPEESLAPFRESIRLDPNDAHYHNDLGMVLAGLNQFDAAHEEFARAGQLVPELAAVHFNDGLVLIQLNRLPEAQSEFEQAIAADPSFTGAHAALGEVFGRQGKMTEAEAQYVTALRLNPDSLDLHVTLGRILASVNRPAEAAVHFQMVLATQPNLPAIQNELGLVLEAVGKMDEAIVHFEAAVRLDPKFTDAAENLRIAKARMGKGKPH